MVLVTEEVFPVFLRPTSINIFLATFVISPVFGYFAFFYQRILFTAVVQLIVEIETSIQKIQILDTVNFGKCLIIDGVMQTAQKDHYLYDRELIKNLQPDDKNILILGGGDGYVAQRVISENPYAHVFVDVVELDVEVVKACERYLGQDVFKNDNVNLHIEDALQYLENTKKNTMESYSISRMRRSDQKKNSSSSIKIYAH